MKNVEATVVLGLQYGDEGKGKITLHHAQSGKFSHCLRFNGGANAGHTVFLHGEKIVTHIVPTGALFGVKSIIGPGCVINEKLFFEELAQIEKSVPDVRKFVKIANNAHVVQDKHIEEEENESKIGTTKRGIGPAYREKYGRTGLRAKHVLGFNNFLIDVYEEFYYQSTPVNILCEGAQASGLDIDWGDYPYVSSSHMGVGSVINNGVPHTSIKSVEGVIKCYETYVGSKTFQNPDDPILDKIGDIGQEFGATTGRRRKVNYLNLDFITKFIEMNSVNILHVNKMDILKELDCWKMIVGTKVINLSSEENFKEMLESRIKNVRYYYSPE